MKTPSHSACRVFVALAIACTSNPSETPAVPDAARPEEPAAVSLFNGADFTGWDRYLGRPSDAEPALGIDNDPRGVYSVVTLDGEPAIRISGEVWGALISQQELGDFHLRAEYKWGALTWPPLNFMDSGIMYLSTGPLGAVNAGGPALSDPVGSGAFMVAMEYQVLPRDVGGCYSLGPIRFEEATRVAGSERAGGWNQVDIVFEAGEARHFLNGELVAGGSSFELEWPGEPVTVLQRGKLQVQSEGAEIFYRHIELLPLP
ncbi:MAG TPA: DUF1080 domain-containing protein [Polyangiaceae bacterium]|nr:DUF1080 domain-containing protein [Polyangiaceae bacterium]